MALERIIKCDVESCPKTCIEEEYGAGFPGWGHMAGVEDEETKRNTAYLCPRHMQRVREILNGG